MRLLFREETTANVTNTLNGGAPIAFDSFFYFVLDLVVFWTNKSDHP